MSKFRRNPLLKKRSVYIIAEAGVNHNGSLKNAFKLIDVAARAKVNAVKFQIFDPERICLPGTEQAEYQKKNFKDNDQISMLKKIALDKKKFFSLKKYAEKKKLDFIVTPFDKENLIFLIKKLKLKIIKIASGDINNFELLNEVKKYKIQLILSTGASNLSEIKKTLLFLKKSKITKFDSSNLTILHCTSDYPAQIDQLNLNVLKKLRKFNHPIGYSDHSDDYFTPSLTVALGAKVIEKHFTLSKKMKGPDHKASLSPNELIKMVKLIRETEIKLGNDVKKVTKSELKNQKIIRRSIVAKKNIKINEKFSFENITCKRPAKGISASKYLSLIGRRSKKNYRANTLI